MSTVEVHKTEGVYIKFPSPLTAEERGGKIKWTWETGVGVMKISADGGKTWVTTYDCDFSMVNAKAVGSYEE